MPCAPISLRSPEARRSPRTALDWWDGPHHLAGHLERTTTRSHRPHEGHLTMPNGRIRMFDAKRRFGFLVSEDGDEYYVPASASTGVLGSGDEVEFQAAETAGNRRAVATVTVLRAAPPGSPVGRTMAAPPSWDVLEESERQRRMARRRRR